MFCTDSCSDSVNQCNRINSARVCSIQERGGRVQKVLELTILDRLGLHALFRLEMF